MSVRSFSEMTYYSALSREKLGQRAKARGLFRDLLAYAVKLQKNTGKDRVLCHVVAGHAFV